MGELVRDHLVRRRLDRQRSEFARLGRDRRASWSSYCASVGGSVIAPSRATNKMVTITSREDRPPGQKNRRAARATSASGRRFGPRPAFAGFPASAMNEWVTARRRCGQRSGARPAPKVAHRRAGERHEGARDRADDQPELDKAVQIEMLVSCQHGLETGVAMIATTAIRACLNRLRNHSADGEPRPRGGCPRRPPG